MELNKTLWHEGDILAFSNYLRMFQNKEKEVWSRSILNTKLELLCLTTQTLDLIAKSIYKGNYISFLDLKIFDTYESIAIYGKLIGMIDDYELMVHYLEIYINQMENWAHVDLLSFKRHFDHKDDLLNLSIKYLDSKEAFIRRLGLMILFQLIKDKTVLPDIYEALMSLKNETNYYVIMMAGWLLSECIIKYQDETLKFIINNSNLNPRIVNKGIQKCRESRRVSQSLKDELLTYKRLNFN